MAERNVVVKTELECWEEVSPLCPYCGTVHSPRKILWTMDETYTELKCDVCGEEMAIEIVTRTLFTTSPIQGWDKIRINKKRVNA